MKIRKTPEAYNGIELCQYGCNQTAKFKFSNGKLCCSTQGPNCSHRRIQAGKKISISRNTEVEPGLTNADLIAKKISDGKYIDVDSSGLNMHERSAIKAASTKLKTLNARGLNIHQLSGMKYIQWLHSENGMLFIKETSERTRNAQNLKCDGISEGKRRALKMVETKLNNIDANGLNSFERAHWKSNRKNIGFIDEVYYQYSNEKRFLEKLKALGILNAVKRGPSIKYNFHGEQKTYMSDFIMGNNLYEIKSTYTLFGINDSFLEKNLRKLDAAQALGYNVVLVVNDVEISYDDFLNSIKEKC